MQILNIAPCASNVANLSANDTGRKLNNNNLYANHAAKSPMKFLYQADTVSFSGKKNSNKKADESPKKDET